MENASGSYFESYMRNNAFLKHSGETSGNKKKLMTDRNAYISFLEVQLERVSAACLTVQSFEKRVAEVEKIQATCEEKCNSVSKIVRLNQDYVEQVGDQMRQEVTESLDRIKKWRHDVDTQIEEQKEMLQRLCNEMEAKEEERTDFANRLQAELNDLSVVIKEEVDDVRTLIGANEARIDSLQVTMSEIEVLAIGIENKVEKCVQRESERLQEQCMIASKEINRMKDKMRHQASKAHESCRSEMNHLVDQSNSEWKEAVETLNHTVQESSTCYDRELLALKKMLKACYEEQQSVITSHKEAIGEHEQQLASAKKENEKVSIIEDNLHKLKSALRYMQSWQEETREHDDEKHEQIENKLSHLERMTYETTESCLECVNNLQVSLSKTLSSIQDELHQTTGNSYAKAVETIDTKLRTIVESERQQQRDMANRVNELETMLRKTRLQQGNSIPLACKSERGPQSQAASESKGTKASGNYVSPIRSSFCRNSGSASVKKRAKVARQVNASKA